MTDVIIQFLCVKHDAVNSGFTVSRTVDVHFNPQRNKVLCFLLINDRLLEVSVKLRELRGKFAIGICLFTRLVRTGSINKTASL